MLVSPLRYPGGKAKLFNFFSNLIYYNQLCGKRYCEPYAGGAGLALRLLSAGFVESISLNDIDEAIWAFWYSVVHHNKEFCQKIIYTKIDIEEWYRQREIWRSKIVADPLSLGFATFFLNRTNRSGIIEGAGPVGGYKQSGNWRLDARFDREKQAQIVNALMPFASRIAISRLDAIEFARNCFADDKSLTYLDPPYYVKGSKLYRNSYVHGDHLAVYKMVNACRHNRWVVSYDAVDPIVSMYEDFVPIFYNLSYSAGTATKGKEVMYLSDGLSLPKIAGFHEKAE